METETMAVELAKPQALETVPVAKDICLTATLPKEMEMAQTQLIEWCKAKIAELTHDKEELEQSYEHAKKQKWKTSVFRSHAIKCAKRILYYEKVLAALESGYVIVPNFPVTTFAIRTNRSRPNPMESNYWSATHHQETSPKEMGVGIYRNPVPVVLVEKKNTPDPNNPNKVTSTYWAERWVEEIDFPINMAKPRIMEATTNAMAYKIFDDLGVLPSPYKREDPMIIGRVLNPYGAPVSFMVAWNLNTRDL